MAALTSLFPFDTTNMISAVNVSGLEYQIRDYQSRNALSAALPVIDELSSMVQGGVHYIGKTTTELSDGAKTNPITIDGKEVAAKQGDMVSRSKTGGQDLEFIFNGTTWYELGSTGSLKSLAFKDTASGKITPAGNLTVDASGALTVNFTNATFTGTESAYTGSLTINAVTGINGTFTGNDATLSADVTAPTSSWTVDFTKVSVENAITGITSHDAISQPPALTTNVGTLDLTANLDGSGVGITDITSTADSITYLTNVGGKSTTFTGTYTPSGTNSLTATKCSGSISITPSNCKPVLTCNTPDVSCGSGTSNFFNSATVTDQVLSFGSGAAMTSVSAKLSTNISANLTAWSGAPAFNGDALSGKIEFTGTNTDISCSGVPDVSASSTEIRVVEGVSAVTGNINVTVDLDPLRGVVLTSATAAYSGESTKATITLGSGTIVGKGSQAIQYAPPKKEISISYKPSGSVVVDDFTPTGSVTTTVKPAGSITGSQSIAAHTHTATFSGTEATVTVS